MQLCRSRSKFGRDAAPDSRPVLAGNEVLDGRTRALLLSVG